MKYVSGTSSCLAPNLVDDRDNPAYEEWMANDDLVWGWIKATVTNQYQLMLQKCKFAYEGWTSLEKILSHTTNTQVTVIKEQLRTLKKLGIEIVQEYIVRVKVLVESLASTGKTLSDNCLRDYIMGGLSSDYRCLLITVRSREPTSFDELTDLLLGEELLVKRINEENQSQTMVVAAQSEY